MINVQEGKWGYIFSVQGLGDQDVDLWALAMCERALPGENFSL